MQMRIPPSPKLSVLPYTGQVDCDKTPPAMMYDNIVSLPPEAMSSIQEETSSNSLPLGEGGAERRMRALYSRTIDHYERGSFPPGSPHPPPLCSGTFPAGEGFWNGCCPVPVALVDDIAPRGASGLKYTGYAVLYDALGSRLTRGEWIEISRIAGFALSNSVLPTRGKMGLNKRHIIRDSGASHRYNNGWVHALRH